MRWHLIVLVLFCLAISPAWAEDSVGNKSQLRTRPRNFSQKVTTNRGIAVRLNQPTLTSPKPLQFGVPELKADAHPSDKQLDEIAKRMNAFQVVVDEALLPVDGKRPTTDAIIGRLRARLLNAPEQLKQDLNNLLIAALVNTRRSGTYGDGQKYDYDTIVWSYRRLDDGGNWGPQIEMQPDSVQLVPVLNLLDKDELKAKTVPDFDIVDPILSGPDPTDPLNAPNDFDVLNLHTHGLNVSPKWPADDIHRQIHPGQLKFFLYQIPADQPAGTYFYHPHKHGSVATQVAGGMAGPLIVRDFRSGLDKLGDENGWGSGTERVLMFQQLTLYKRDLMAFDVFTRPDFFALKDVDIALGQTCKGRPEIQKIANRLAGNPDPRVRQLPIFRLPAIETWVSGAFQPSLYQDDMSFGEIRRLRLIHAGVEENINFTIQPTTPGWPAAMLQVIAFDGIPLQQPYFISDKNQLTLSPGNRADVLVSVPPVPGKLYVDKLEYAVLQRGSDVVGDNIFAKLTIDPAKAPPAKASFINSTQAQNVYDACKPKMSTPLRQEQEPFELAFADASIDDQGVFTPGTFQINRSAFPQDQKFFRLQDSRYLEFSVVRGDAPHPLHIHVNSFRLDADPGRGALGLPTCEFWADTLLIQPQNPVVVAMPFNHWTGESVSHCHILDHEDAGMMNVIRIRPEVFSWPEFPVNQLMEMPYFPKNMLTSLTTSWPRLGDPVSASNPQKVSIFVFMPAALDGKACPHCAAAVQAVSSFRKRLKDPGSIRIVAITAASPKQLPDPRALAESLKLIADHDVLCVDPELHSFESIGLIDGTPILQNGELRFPGAFLPNSRQPKWASDVMHGLFIADKSGMVVSARRAFLAFDDTDQIMREVELAGQSRPTIQSAYEKAVKSEKSPVAAQRLESQRARFEQRVKLFEAKKQ